MVPRNRGSILSRLLSTSHPCTISVHACEREDGGQNKFSDGASVRVFCFLSTLQLFCSHSSSIIPLLPHIPPHLKQLMVQFQRDEPPVSQKFKRSTGTEPQLLPVQVCPGTGRSCIFWQDVENIYPDVEYVYRRQPWTGDKRILFMVDQYGEVYV